MFRQQIWKSVFMLTNGKAQETREGLGTGP